MRDISKRIANLSPEQRALLQKKLTHKAASRAEPQPQKPSVRTPGQPVPLSFGQERMWFVDQLQPGSPAYNMPVILPLQGVVSVPVLEQCLTEIVRRHEALRTTFAMRDGTPMQIIHAPGPVVVSVADVSQLPHAAGRDAELQRLLAAEIQRGFDLEKGPLLRATLVRLTAGDKPEHMFVCVMHHIISDAWSLSVFMRELGALYAAFSVGRPSPLPELPIQYGDFALWQRETLKGQRLADLLSHWKEKLKGAPLFLKLPVDRPRSGSHSQQGSVYSFTLPAELCGELRALGERARTTMFMTTLAAFNVLLSLYTAVDDLIVGTPIANRSRSELEPVIGFFLNTLPLRTRLEGDPTFLELLEHVREETLDAYAHQDLPFEMLVEAIRPERSLSVHPIFQVMFVMQSALGAGGAAGPAGPAGNDPAAVPTGKSRFDLTLSLVESEHSIAGSIEYSTELFDASTMQRMAGHFAVLLADIARDPTKRLSQLAMVTPAEEETLRRWNATAADLEAVECLHHLLERQSTAAPDSAAVEFEGTSLSYRALNARANQVAHHLRALGVGPETVVGLFTERSIEMIVGLFGILKAGAAYLPLDPTYPADRLQFMLADTSVPIVLTHERCVDRLPESGGQVLVLDRDWDVIARYPEDNPHSGVRPDHPAYVIYTSGSSGRPKGVVVPHRGVCNATEVEYRLYRTRPGDRVLQFASINFDASMFEIVMSVRGGSTLQLVTSELIRSGSDLVRFLEERAVTVLAIPPSALSALPVARLPALRLILVMGEECPPELVARWRHVPEFFNAYGPTEASMWMVGTFLSPDRPVTIGRPIANTRVYLLDSHLRQVPIGVPGELFIGGICVTRGYLKRPDLTAQRFLPDLFSDESGARMYRTGDLAAYTPTGEIQFLGRLDNQVKIRAFRIELGEIETALAQHPNVQAAVVSVRDDLPSGRGLVGYLIARAPAPSTSELRKFLLEKLPDYMVPAAFVVLDAFPLSQAGKADRRALPAPRWDRSDLDTSFLAPTTSVERVISQIWASVLGLPRVGVHDNFFELGGHSLLATQIITRLREVFQLELPIRLVFEHPTVAGMSAMIEAELASRGRSFDPAAVAAPASVERGASSAAPTRQDELARPPAPRGDVDAVSRHYPLSFAQERLWFLRQLNPDDLSYNLPIEYPLGSVEPERLRTCLDEIVRRHEILRTTFHLERGRPIQRVAPELALELPVVDMRAEDDSGRQARRQQVFAIESRRRFDLRTGPLIRATLIILSETACSLLIVMDHIISDGWSLGLLFQELAALYEASLRGVHAPLPALALQYGEHAERQRARLQGEVLAQSIQYWRNKLSGAPPRIELPFDHPRKPATQDSEGGAVYFGLPEDVSARWRALGQAEQMTSFIVQLSLFQAFLWRHVRQDTIVVGSPVTNRGQAELEKLIGFFVNMLVLRADFSDRMTFRELLRQMRETALEAYAHQELPLEKLIEELQPERDPTVNPIFQVMFTHQSVSATQDQGAIQSAMATMRNAQFDLSLYVADDGRAIRASIEYKSALFDRPTIERMAARLLQFSTNLIEDIDRPIADIPLLTEAEHQAIAACNRTDARYATEICLHDLFAAQVARTPNAIAAVFEAQEITYVELARRAGQVARHLRELGIRAESLVGICLERSIDLITGILGVLIAGGAYVPLDPELPDERLRLMIEDAGLPVVLAATDLVTRLAPSKTQLVSVSDCVAGKDAGQLLPRTAGPHNAAYAIYTSGSTGVPKGAINTHQAVVNRLLWMQETFGLTPADRVLQKTSIGFDVSVWELLWPILTGASLVFAAPGQHRDASYLAGAIARHQITHVHFVPSMLQAFLDHAGPLALPSLRRVVCSGEELTPALQDAFFRRIASCELHNLYGPTEAAIDVTWWPCRVDPARHSVPIGHAIANTRIHILDRHLNEVAVGVTGEIYIGGIAPARGYLRRPALTAERFLPDPIDAAPGARMYRTGDLGRRLVGGEIEYLGRIDHQVKIRGVRIELGEISATLLGFPGVREAVVLLDGDKAAAERRLVAYYVRHPDHAIDPHELQRWVHQKLPFHMVPALYLELEALPLTPNGKLDRKALPRPGAIRGQRGQIVAPRNPLEELLVWIWAEVLHVDRVSVEDNFFQLGGHSLIAVQMLSRIREALAVEVPVSRLFNAPTPALLAAEVLKLAEEPEAIQAQAAELVRRSHLPEGELVAMLEGPRAEMTASAIKASTE
jgi:amino acid adenylation domain-containing protein